jgi:GT2 family glycosyltransferase/glycosyltransferase involved in cell wall biosynthesis
MKTSPRFSVILCTYNRCYLVLAALASLREQTLPYGQFEVIVVDNGSNDGTLEAVRSYVSAGMQEEKGVEDVWQGQCLWEPQNGLAYARKTGLLAAKGEVAVFLHDDALADPHWLEHLLTAYEETGADAIGGRVEIDWGVARPYWFSEELLETLGYFAPSRVRMQLEGSTSFNGCNFSVKIEALRAIGYFSPLLSKSPNMPLSTEMDDLCYRLRDAGYSLWYEPEAMVVHRAPAVRLTRSFFVGRAYWQGRSEVLLEYAQPVHNEPSMKLLAILPELRELAYLALLHRPLLSLAGRSTNERLLAAMEQARNWGRLQQRLQLPKRPSRESNIGAVLFVRPAVADPTAELLTQALTSQGVDCSIEIEGITLSWLWEHRQRDEGTRSIVHFYRVGAFNLTYLQRRWFRFWLWLAQLWGFGIITTDAGGWWQSSHSLRFLSRRLLERKVIFASNVVLAYTRQPAQLYYNRQLRRKVRCLPHPGFRDYYGPSEPCAQAREQLGLPKVTGTVYLCFAYAHTEQEVVLLMKAFQDLKSGKQQKKAEPRLLLVGLPADKRSPTQLLRLAALNPNIHLSMTTPCKEDIPLYMGAADVIVLPHFSMHTAGILEMAILALSYEHVVIAPNLPRFRGMLPPRASILYDPTRRTSLVRALSKAQTSTCHLNAQEAVFLEAESGWREYTQRLLKLYQQLR